MASTNTGTTGGVVDLSMIIAQINATNMSMETIVDAVIDSTNVIVLAAKVKIAKAKLKKATSIMVDFITSMSKEIRSMLDVMEQKLIQEASQTLSSNPGALQQNITANPNDAVKLLANKSAGVMEFIIGLNSVLNLMMQMNVPSSIKLKLKLFRIKRAVRILQNNLSDILWDLKILEIALSESVDPKVLNKLLAGINNIIHTVISAMSYVMLIAFITPIFIASSVIALTGITALIMVIRSIVNGLNSIGSPKYIVSTERLIGSIKSIIRNILLCILYITATLAAIATTIIIASMVGGLIMMLLPSLLAGIFGMVFMFGLMTLALKIVNRLARTSSLQAEETLLHMIILSGILVILAGVFMMLAQVADMVNGNIMSIVVLLGFMGLVLLSLMGFMVLAAFVAPALVVGTAALAAVVMSVLILTLLTLTLMLLVVVAKILDPEAVKAAVDKVLITAEYVVQSILARDFGAPEKKSLSGEDQLDQELAREIFGANIIAIFDIMAKVAILFFTVLAIGVMFMLAGMLMLFTQFYNSFKNYIVGAPEAVNNVMMICTKVIEAVLNARPNISFGESQDPFDRLISHVMNSNIAVIFGLLSKVVIVFFTIVVLAMLKVLILELSWLYSGIDEGKLNEYVNKVDVVMNVCTSIIENVLNHKPKSEMGGEDDTFSKLISYVSSSDLVTIFRLLSKVVVISLTMVVLAMLKVIVDEMRWLIDSTNDFDFVELENRVGMIMNTVDGIINVLSTTVKEPDGKPRNGLQKLLKIIGMDKLAEVIGLLCAFARIGVAVAALSVMMSVVNIMKACWETYNEMGGEKIGANAVSMTNGLLIGLDSIITTLNDSKVKIGDVDGSLESLQATIPLFTTIMNITKLMKKAVNELQGIDDANLQKIDITCKKISESFNKLLDGEEGLLPFVVEHSQSYSAVVKDTDKLINRINGLNISKLDSLAKMFGHAAAFAQAIDGNFDKLADAINEKLAPILEGLQKTIDNADQHIKEYTEKQSQAPAQVVQTAPVAPVATNGPVPPGGANPTLQGAGQNKDVQAAAQVDITSQIESALRSFFRTNDGKILVSTT